MTLFLVVGTAMADVLSSSATSHGFTMDQTLGQEAADAQIEDVRALPYDSVGTTSGNPPGSVAPTESATAVGITGLAATVTTSIHFVGDGIPDGYNSTTNYKQVIVTRHADLRRPQPRDREHLHRAADARALRRDQPGRARSDRHRHRRQPAGAGCPDRAPDGTQRPAQRHDRHERRRPLRGDDGEPDLRLDDCTTTSFPRSRPATSRCRATSSRRNSCPGQITNLSIRVYQPATIYVNLTSGGAAYTGSATVTVTPASGDPADLHRQRQSGRVVLDHEPLSRTHLHGHRVELRRASSRRRSPSASRTTTRTISPRRSRSISRRRRARCRSPR